MPNLIEQRVAQARAGENPTVLCQMPSGWTVIGDQQFIPGYCLLLADPVVPPAYQMAAWCNLYPGVICYQRKK